MNRSKLALLSLIPISALVGGVAYADLEVQPYVPASVVDEAVAATGLPLDLPALPADPEAIVATVTQTVSGLGLPVPALPDVAAVPVLPTDVAPDAIVATVNEAIGGLGLPVELPPLPVELPPLPVDVPALPVDVPALPAADLASVLATVQSTVAGLGLALPQL